MAEVIWAEPALTDLDRIADYIALDKPVAAEKFVQKVFDRVELLSDFPKMGKRPRELPRSTLYREVVVKPCRIFYRPTEKYVFIVHVMRGEQLLKVNKLER